ncbi:serine/threonine-protein kinase, partial [Pseudonocardia zijingensis]
MSPASDDTPVRVGGRYRLDERIGAGAMGAVWRATDELLNRTVAVKELLAAAAPPTAAGNDALEVSRQRILREGRIGARLQHPHVISMFDVVVHEDRPWLVMEYLPSRSLAQVLGDKGPLPPEQVGDIGRQVADGLAAAHLAGVTHRDVKPGNVLIADDGRVKLTDFGVSRAVDDVQLTRTGLIAGTPAFLSPEVARGLNPTAASDVFALGATLYAAVEGTPPFGLDDNAYALLHKVATEQVRRPKQDGPVVDMIMRLLSREPDDRPSAAQARDAFAAVIAGSDPGLAPLAAAAP